MFSKRVAKVITFFYLCIVETKMVNSFFEVLLTRAKDVRVETPPVFPVNNPQIYLGVVEALTSPILRRSCPFVGIAHLFGQRLRRSVKGGVSQPPR
jgi:hypothetical protein